MRLYSHSWKACIHSVHDNAGWRVLFLSLFFFFNQELKILMVDPAAFPCLPCDNIAGLIFLYISLICSLSDSWRSSWVVSSGRRMTCSQGWRRTRRTSTSWWRNTRLPLPRSISYHYTIQVMSMVLCYYIDQAKPWKLDVHATQPNCVLNWASPKLWFPILLLF